MKCRDYSFLDGSSPPRVFRCCFCNPMMWLIKNLMKNMFGHFLAWIPDSRHVRQSKYTVVHEESDVQVKNKQCLHPEGKNKEKRIKKKYVLLSLSFNPMNGLKRTLFWKIDPLWNRRQSYRIDSKVVPREILTCWSRIWRQKPSNPPPRPRNEGKPPP